MPTGATLDELRGAAESILGPTDDAIADLAVFGPMPAGVPTPPGSFVDDFSVSVARMNDETSANGYVELVPSIPVADATTLYLTAFADLGMTIGSDSTAQNDSGTLRRVDFDAVADAASPTVYAVEFLDADDDTVRLSFEGPTTADAVAIFDGWSSAIPRPAGGTVTRGSLSGSLYGSSVATTYTYETDDAAGLLGQVAAATPAAGLTVDTDLSDETAIVFDTDDLATGLTYASAATSSGIDEGTSDLSLNGSFDITAPIPPPPDTAANTTAASGAPTSVAGPTSTVARPPFEPAITAGSDLAAATAVLGGILGPTTDALGEISGLVPIPGGVPTAPDASVTAYSLDTSDYLGDGEYTYHAVVDLTTSMALPEAMAMYRTTLTSVGFVPTTQSTQSDDDKVVTAQAFDIPGTTSDVAELVVLTIDGDADYIELQLDDATTSDSFGLCSVVATFTALAPGASPQSCGAQSGGDELQLDAEFVVAGDGATAFAAAVDAMTAAGLTVEPGTPDDTYRAFSGSGVDGALSWYENVSDATTTLSISLYVPA